VPAAPAASAELTVEASPALAAAASEVKRVDLDDLDRDLRRAGLALPPSVDVTLIANDDPRAARIPRWIVGLAAGDRDVLILPDRVLPYPYDSIASVLRHEVTHLALSIRAGNQPLPRWFHEGVATSVDRGWGVAGQLRLLVEMLRNPGTADLARLFASDTQPDTALAYGLSAALVSDLRQRHGDGVPGAVAARVGGGMPFAAAFALEVGETPDSAAARAWAAYRRWTNWVPSLTSGSAVWLLTLALAVAAYAAQRRRRRLRRQRWAEDEEPGF
jgi:hypothetical protein